MFAYRPLFRFGQKRRFDELSEREVLALAISSEEEDSQIYLAYAEALRPAFPATASVFEAMSREEDGHRKSLIELYQTRFGNFIVPIRREHIADFVARSPVWLIENLGIDRIRQEAADMERQTRDFYLRAARRATDAATRTLLGDLAVAEMSHKQTAEHLADQYLHGSARDEENRTASRQFLLTWIQPGLAGLMDGSVSTLAPIFATAFATHDPRTTLLVGLSAAIGAGISMGFTEAVHDDGKLSGRGSPLKRGLSSGIMTAVGGLGHALPYLIPSFWTATVIALVVVFLELWAIVWIQNRFMETPFFRATLQVVLGGALVLAAGILIGGS